MGGYDIFVSKLSATGKWSEPENIGYPINTTDDDMFYYPWQNARIGYISLIREGGYGKEDIYAVQQDDDKPLPLLLADFFKEKEKPVTPALAEVKPVETPELEQPTQPPQPSQIVVKATPKEIELAPVYFAFDNFQLTDDGKKQLDKVYRLLTDYPVARVRLIGHADAKGTAEYNLKLSEKRAAIALQYLTGKGIDKGKLEVLGLGEKNFAAVNSNPDGSDNPEGRGLNRRVEYEIISSDDSLIIIRMPAIPEKLKFRE
jgi:outer membrane protein OmpA-like peptidoglycan-associated protein